MATFFSTSITLSMMPPLFFAFDPTNSEATASMILLFLLVIYALLYLLLRAYRKTTRHRELTCLVIVLFADTIVKLILLGWPLSFQASTALRWVYLATVAPMLICLAITWAGACDYFDGRDLRVLIPLAMLLSVFVGVGARMIGEAFELNPGTAQSFLSLASGIIGTILLRRQLAATPTMPLGDSEISHDPETFAEFHPTGEVKGARSLFAAWVALWVFLMGTAMFVGYYSQGFKLDALQGEGHVLAVLLLACGIIAIARLAEKHLLRFQVSLIIFIGFCLIALYVTASIGNFHPEIAKNVLLPVRACAIIFSWLILEEFCRERNRPFAPVAVIAFFPLVIASALAAIVFGGVLHGTLLAEASAIVGNACLATAFLVTVSSFFVVRYGWGSDNPRGASAAAEQSVEPATIRDRLFSKAPGSTARSHATAGHPSGEKTPEAGNEHSSADEHAGEGGSRSNAITEERALEIIRFQYSLTNREFDMLRLTMRGHTQKGMADELYLSINSISTYVKLFTLSFMCIRVRKPSTSFTASWRNLSKNAGRQWLQMKCTKTAFRLHFPNSLSTPSLKCTLLLMLEHLP